MSGSMEERLRLVVDASTQGATTAFDRLGSAADDTAKKAKSAGDDVAAAADKVAQARLREQDAAGKLSVAEVRLQELRDNGAKASQIAAAEERVASAQRSLQAATGATTRAVEEQTQAQARATTEAGRAEQASQDMGSGMDDLKGKIIGLVAGAGLTDWLRDSVAGFLEGARGANALSSSMNATVEQAGQLYQLMNSVGLETDDLLEIQAEFATKSVNGMNLLGQELIHNRDGTVNWALSLTDALTELQKIPDATERNRQGFAMFGEEGYKQLSRLLNSGMSVADALEQIGTPFSEADVIAAQQYDRAMMNLQSAVSGTGRSLARDLVPLLTEAITAFGQVVGIVTAIPAPLAAATVAAIALGVTGWTPASLAGGRLAVVMATLRTEMGLLSAGMIGGGAAAGVLGAGMSGAAVAGRGLATMLGGPLGLALLAGGGLIAGYSHGLQQIEEGAAKAVPSLDKLAGELGSMEAALARQALELDDNAGYWERLSASIDAGVNPVIALGTSFSDMNQTVGAQKKALDEAREALGAAAAQQEVAQIAQRGLTDLIAEGTTAGAEFAEKVREAAEAQRDQSATSDIATAALAAYEAVTRGAFQATVDLLGTQLQQSDGLIAVQKAAHELGSTVDDLATPWNEVAEQTNAALNSALAYGSQAADAAVAAAAAAGTVLDPLTEAQTRADATIAALRESLNAPGLTADAQAQLQSMIDQLTTAKDKGDIQAVLSLTGVPEAESQLATVTEDQNATVTVDSAGGPAVIDYLRNDVAGGNYLATVRVESRNGPAVLDYIRSIVEMDRLARIQVESRNGPMAKAYIDSIADQQRLALIRVESRNGPAVDDYLNGLARTRTATIQVRQQAVGAPVTPGSPTDLSRALRGAPALTGVGGSPMVNVASMDLHLVGTLDRGQLSRAEQGRAAVQNIRAFEKQNGTSWRNGT